VLLHVIHVFVKGDIVTSVKISQWAPFIRAFNLNITHYFLNFRQAFYMNQIFVKYLEIMLWAGIPLNLKMMRQTLLTE